MPYRRSANRTSPSRANTNAGRTVARNSTPPPVRTLTTSPRPDGVDDPAGPRRAGQPGRQPRVPVAQHWTADLLVRAGQRHDLAAEAHLERAHRRQPTVAGPPLDALEVVAAVPFPLRPPHRFPVHELIGVPVALLAGPAA